MGFFSSIVSATVKTVLSPIAVVKDIGNTIVGEEVDSTKKHIDGISIDVEEAFDDIT